MLFWDKRVKKDDRKRKRIKKSINKLKEEEEKKVHMKDAYKFNNDNKDKKIWMKFYRNNSYWF